MCIINGKVSWYTGITERYSLLGRFIIGGPTCEAPLLNEKYPLN